MSKVVSMRLRDDQVKRLDRIAGRLKRPPSQTAALLLEEALRLQEFPDIVFKDTIIEREAFLTGTRIKVWQVEELARVYDRDLAKVAEHLDEPVHRIEAAIAYAQAFPDEMETAIAGNSRSYEELKRILPNLKLPW